MTDWEDRQAIHRGRLAMVEEASQQAFSAATVGGCQKLPHALEAYRFLILREYHSGAEYAQLRVELALLCAMELSGVIAYA